MLAAYTSQTKPQGASTFKLLKSFEFTADCDLKLKYFVTASALFNMVLCTICRLALIKKLLFVLSRLRM